MYEAKKSAIAPHHRTSFHHQPRSAMALTRLLEAIALLFIINPEVRWR
ncbi:MAG: hypothetical protein KME38_06870 [Spirirestis rafaelensis WJT71-NPBG6]|jgi:hypothetical protein|nr:hypothetical protein [Spirirestis rafaelensis WJT71-NPBG6]